MSSIYPIHDDQDDAHTEHERIKERKQNRADLLLRSLELLGIMDAATQGRDLFFQHHRDEANKFERYQNVSCGKMYRH